MSTKDDDNDKNELNLHPLMLLRDDNDELYAAEMGDDGAAITSVEPKKINNLVTPKNLQQLILKTIVTLQLTQTPLREYTSI